MKTINLAVSALIALLLTWHLGWWLTTSHIAPTKPTYILITIYLIAVLAWSSTRFFKLFTNKKGS